MPLALSINYRILVLVAILLPVLLWLGQWQLHRAAEKEAIQSVYTKRQNQDPVSFAQLKEKTDLAFLPVRLHGRFVDGPVFLLDNKVQNGQVGYEILVPFQLEDDTWVIVNRGWIKGPALRTELPEIPPLPDTVVDLQAEIYVPPGQGFQLAGVETPEDQWPRVITTFDRSFLTHQLGHDIFIHQLRLKAGQPGALVINWPPISISPEKHRAYAVQWFAMAAALLLWLLFASVSTRKRR